MCVIVRTGRDLSLRCGQPNRINTFFTVGSLRCGLIKKVWQRPTLPPKGSTIGAEGLNFRVRDGNGWFPFAVVTRLNIQFTVISRQLSEIVNTQTILFTVN